MTLITSEEVYKNITGNNDIRRMFIQLKENSNKDNLSEYLKVLNKKTQDINILIFKRSQNETGIRL